VDGHHGQYLLSNTDYELTLPPQQDYEVGVDVDSFLTNLLRTTPPQQFFTMTPPRQMTPPQQILASTPPRQMTPPQQITTEQQTTPPHQNPDETMQSRESDRRRDFSVIYERRRRRRRAPDRFTPSEFGL